MGTMPKAVAVPVLIAAVLGVISFVKWAGDPERGRTEKGVLSSPYEGSSVGSSPTGAIKPAEPKVVPKHWESAETASPGQIVIMIDERDRPDSDDIRVVRANYLLESLGQRSGMTPENVSDMTLSMVDFCRTRFGRDIKMMQFLEAANTGSAFHDKASFASYIALLATTTCA